MVGPVRSPLRLRHVVVVAAGTLIVLFAAGLNLKPGGDFLARAVDDLGQSFAAVLGSLGCAYRAWRTRGRWRLSWSLFALACLSWAPGNSSGPTTS